MKRLIGSLVAVVCAGSALAQSNRSVETIAVDASLTDTPRLVKVAGVSLDSKFSKQISSRGDSDCGSSTPSKPIATVELKEAMPAGFRVVVTGGGNDGFVLVRQDKVFWTVCAYTTSEIPTMGAPQEGWAAGRYDVYPLGRSSGVADFTVELFNAEKPAPWSDAVKKVSLGKKLDKPLFIEVTTRAGRQVLREAHSGSSCGEVPLATEPDLALTLERPIPGLVVRPLLARAPVTLRVQEPSTDKRKGNKYCASYQRQTVPNAYAPTFEAASEAHLNSDAEGTFGLSVAIPDGSAREKVTLMIFDASTQFDRLAVMPVQGELPTIQSRALAPFYPQLDVRELALSKHADAELQATLFATAAKELFVYAKLDLDKDIARSLTNDAFPSKNEPLLVVKADADRSIVMTADGLELEVKNSHLLLKPDGNPAVPAAPRTLKKDEPLERVLALMPLAAKPILAEFEARQKKHDDCVDRVWGPFGKQIGGASWTVRDGSGRTTTVESPRVQKIRLAGDAAMAKACGTGETRAKDREATRVKLLGEVEKERGRLYAQVRQAFK